MNFLMRSGHQAPVEQVPSVKEPLVDRQYVSRPSTTLEGLIAEYPFPQYSIPEERNGETHGVGGENGSSAGSSSKNDSVAVDNHSDVLEEDGWITIPKNELPDDWNNAPDIHSLRSLDRPFVFAGEQVHILACLSAYKQDTEIITPFKVAAMMSKNSSGQSPEKQNGEVKNGWNSVSGEKRASPDGQVADENCENPPKLKTDPLKDISASESILRMEDHRRQTEMLLQRFKDSHFFVRIAESGELLWSKKDASKGSPESLGISGQRSAGNGINAIIDTGKFDANVSGGVARNTIQCYSLSSGDIVVLLQVNIGVNYLSEPIIEILQFEKFVERNMSSENQENLVRANDDPCRDLLKWLLPLDNTLPPPARSLSPPPLSSSTVISGASQKPTLSASSGSQLFSFGHFRSYSMSSLPQNTPPSATPVKAQSSKPSFDLEDWDHYLSQKFLKNQRTGSEGLLSFRGVSLERERFSVRCGLEGIYIPGRRWRRKIEIIQPVEIHSFAADCNAEDLICVRIKNISPAHAPDIVVYIDAISIVFEEAAKGGAPSSLPIACIEAGNEHSLPNLALRKGEEHSFILKPAPCMWKTLKVNGEKGSWLKNLHLPSSTVEGRRIASSEDRYAIMVSCRCNYTESRLFFKQPTSWRPRISRDIMISVASEMSGESSGSNGRVSQLPVQVLTLQASNLTSDDLTLTVLAPASFTSPPTVGSLSSSPSSPLSPFINVSEFPGQVTGDRYGTAMQRLNSAPPAIESERQAGDNDVRSASFVEQSTPVSDVINSGLGCTHLWLQSRIPLGCVPSKSTATIKLELLPLTDGIITLDTLQIEVKEKGLTYIPEHSLKINATSSISTGIV
ncbi:hypothetical protein HS088_TW06G00852 [Tripterygium wilfordii]|uniref:Uncharacterized protein n=1 Tax=Tripterygium wilfordii TaxID=458696 RepID=A0A7J7DJY4_TRIWF|nr:uncharacterized protein LOC120000265 [Tripterygium wilfordii]XP_038704173.1 uncharacterized protein LOC120000265 [Tripterygium wilfordii]KAF5746680.1 hypothetical protein HS088_TW06G00852 [Tripterygium wilfordii]